MRPTTEYRQFLLEQLGGEKDKGLAYLEACQEEGGISTFLVGLKNVVDARIGMTMLARHVDATRPTLYNALSSNGNPRIHDLEQILTTLGFRLTVAPVAKHSKDAKTA